MSEKEISGFATSTAAAALSAIGGKYGISQQGLPV